MMRIGANKFTSFIFTVNTFPFFVNKWAFCFTKWFYAAEMTSNFAIITVSVLDILWVFPIPKRIIFNYSVTNHRNFQVFKVFFFRILFFKEI